MGFRDYINGLAALAIASTAAALSATLLKTELLPEQLGWLGGAGTVVAACMIAITFTFRRGLERRGVKPILACVLGLTCIFVVWLRAARVVEVTVGGSNHRLLVGGQLTPSGETAKATCKADSDEQLVSCAGIDLIPVLFGGSYKRAMYYYIWSYLLMLAAFVPLISALDLQNTNQIQSNSAKSP
jgi:hypothetical protein